MMFRCSTRTGFVQRSSLLGVHGPKTLMIRPKCFQPIQFQIEYQDTKSDCQEVEQLERNFEYVKYKYLDMVDHILQACDLDKPQNRQLLAMFISSHFVKILDFQQGVTEEKRLYHHATGIHFILETDECESADDFKVALNDFLDIARQTRF